MLLITDIKLEFFSSLRINFVNYGYRCVRLMCVITDMLLKKSTFTSWCPRFVCLNTHTHTHTHIHCVWLQFKTICQLQLFIMFISWPVVCSNIAIIFRKNTHFFLYDCCVTVRFVTWFDNLCGRCGWHVNDL